MNVDMTWHLLTPNVSGVNYFFGVLLVLTFFPIEHGEKSLVTDDLTMTCHKLQGSFCPISDVVRGLASWGRICMKY